MGASVGGKAGLVHLAWIFWRKSLTGCELNGLRLFSASELGWVGNVAEIGRFVPAADGVVRRLVLPVRVLTS